MRARVVAELEARGLEVEAVAAAVASGHPSGGYLGGSGPGPRA